MQIEVRPPAVDAIAEFIRSEQCPSCAGVGTGGLRILGDVALIHGRETTGRGETRP